MGTYSNISRSISISETGVKFAKKSFFGKKITASFKLPEISKVELFFVSRKSQMQTNNFPYRFPLTFLGETVTLKSDYKMEAVGTSYGGTLARPAPVALFFIKSSLALRLKK